MAFTTLIITVFIAATINTASTWDDDQDFVKNYGLKFASMNFKPFPSFPTFPQFTFPTFPTFPTIPPIVIMTPQDIANKKGPNYNGIAVSSSSSSTVDKDGNVVQTGGATIVTNKDGVVKEYKFGDDPSQVSVISVSEP